MVNPHNIRRVDRQAPLTPKTRPSPAETAIEPSDAPATTDTSTHHKEPLLANADLPSRAPSRLDIGARLPEASLSPEAPLSSESLAHLTTRLRSFRLSRPYLQADLDTAVTRRKNERLIWSVLGVASAALLIMNSGLQPFLTIAEAPLDMIGKLAIAGILIGWVVREQIVTRRDQDRARQPTENPDVPLVFLSGAQALLVHGEHSIAHLLLASAVCNKTDPSNRIWAAHLLLRAIEKAPSSNDRLNRLDSAIALMVMCPHIQDDAINSLGEFTKGIVRQYLHCFDDVRFHPERDTAASPDRLKLIGKFLKHMNTAPHEIRTSFKEEFESLGINPDMLFI